MSVGIGPGQLRRGVQDRAAQAEEVRRSTSGSLHRAGEPEAQADQPG